MKMIVSATHGRMRLMASALSDQDFQAGLIQVLQGLDHVQSVRGNPAASSIVLNYDPEQISKKEMEAVVTGCTSQFLAIPVNPHPGNTLKRRINRYAKYGAIASLGASLVFAYTGRKRLHIATGWLFVGFLAAHMYVHRKQTFR